MLRPAAVRILIVGHCPLDRELGAAQIHLNLADGLRELGHSVRLWSPWPMEAGTHWATVEYTMREKLRAFLRTAEDFDLVDCPAFLNGRGFLKRKVTWVCRSVQPDIQYMVETLRARRGTSAPALTKTAFAASKTAALATLICLGWASADFIMCLGEVERAWIARKFPWLGPKLRAYDGAITEADGAEMKRVRESRRPRRDHEPVRYLWIGRWAEHKGVALLEVFLRERLTLGLNEQFTIAGCGAPGERALASLLDSQRVRVVPTFTRGQLPGLLGEHHAGLFTSRVEGWGLVLNEMLESGLPVFATSAGGVKDLQGALGPAVQAFPPPAMFVSPPPPSAEQWARYDDRFRWKTIAARYVESVATGG
jgi:glycosyltransferase involved in cell wall biosynthesis